MTITGKVFKGYAEAIIAKHGFGSNKMVLDWSTDFLKGVNESFSSLVPKTDPQNAKAFEVWKECFHGQDFLIKNGYLRTYRPEYLGHKGRKIVKKHGSLYVGLTDKGWSVANRYLESEA